MKKRAVWVTMAIAFLFVVRPPVVRSQITSTSEKTFEGQLTRIDAAMKVITIKGKEDKEIKEMSFRYDDNTRVVAGGDRTVQGLTGKTGSMLRITYRMDRGSNEATQIEVMGEQPQ